jgi:hypothetical protein
MKKYKNTDEITASKYFVTCTFREELLIGQLAFQIYIYLLDIADEDRFLFGCFHHDETVSPAFDSYNDCLKYAINIYNTEMCDKYVKMKEEEKKLLMGFAYKKCAKHTLPEPENDCCGGLNGKDHLGDPTKNRKRSKQL